MISKRTCGVRQLLLLIALIVSSTSASTPTVWAQDTTAPELTEFTFTPTAINTDGAPATVTATFRLLDPLSGACCGFVEFRNVATGVTRGSSFGRISGNTNDGIYEAAISFPQYSAGGAWQVSDVHVVDLLNNTHHYSTAELTGLGFPTDLTNAGTLTDTTPPELTEFTFTPTAINTDSAPAAVTATFRLLEPLSGTCCGFVEFRNATTGVTFGSSFGRISGDSHDGIYEAVLPFPQYSQGGVWRVSDVHVTDLLNNTHHYSTAELAGLGFPTDLTNAGTLTDTAPPELTEFTFTPRAINTDDAPATVTATFRLLEPLSGTCCGFVTFQNVTTGGTFGVSFGRISGDSHDGIYEAVLHFPQYTQGGVWRVSDVHVVDALNNTHHYSTAELTALGFPTNLLNGDYITPNAWTTRGPEGGQITSLAIAPTAPQTVVAGTMGTGALRTTNGGNAWGILTNGSTRTSVAGVAISPLSADDVALATNGSLLRTTDGGSTWTSVNLGGALLTVSFAPSQPSRMYAAGNSMFRSLDGGASWQSADGGLPADGSRIRELAVDPNDPLTVLIAKNESVYKTVDGGDNWTPAATGLTAGAGRFAFDPHLANTVYAATRTGLFKSTNGAGSWSQVGSGITPVDTTSVTVDPASSSIVYAGTRGGGVFRSIDGGNSFTAVPGGFFNKSIAALVHSSDGTLYTGTEGSGVWKTTNGGATWTEANSGVRAHIVGGVVVDTSTSPSTIFAATGFANAGGTNDRSHGGGVFRSRDGGVFWEEVNDGLTETSISALAIEPGNPPVLYAGSSASSSRLFKSVDRGETWTLAATPPGSLSALAVQTVGPATLYAGGYGTGLFKSVDGGATFTNVTSAPLDSNVLTIAPDPAIAGTVYVGSYSGVFKTIDAGATWTNVSTGLFNPFVLALTVDPADSLRLFAGTTGGAFRSLNGGLNWSVVLNGDLRSIALHPADSTVVYAGTTTGVYKSIDSGSTWRSFEAGLENSNDQGLAISVDPAAPTHVFLGTNGASVQLIDDVCGNAVSDGSEQCDEGRALNGTTAACCNVDCTYRPANASCRPSEGQCDVSEICSGSNGSCPADLKSTAVCRSAVGVCDLAENCDGASDDCPDDELAGSATTCRPTAGVCDVAEQCDGVSTSCPTDAKSTATCRAAGGVCDVAETCDGIDDACPADQLEPGTTVCRVATGVCDIAEACTGTNPVCPTDAKSTGVCRPAIDTCDASELCDGIGADCPSDGSAVDGTTCNDGDVCTVADACQAGTCAGTTSQPTYTVTSKVDAPDAVPGDGVCSTVAGTGPCTLRAAIQEANADACGAASTIVLPPGTYKLTLTGIDEELSASGDLDLHGNVVLSGAGSAATVIDANGTDRAIHVLPGAVATVRGVTIRNGRNLGPVTSGSGVNGGAIFNAGSLVLDRDVVRNSRVTLAGASGGAIYNAGSLTVVETTISGNSGAVEGGGTYNDGGTFSLTSSTVSGNSADRGGGIATASGSVTLTNATISGNTAALEAGGIASTASSVTLSSSTVTANTATSVGAIAMTGGSCSLSNTIIGGNAPESCNGTLLSTGYNLIADATSCNVSGDPTGNVVDVAPALGPLQYNGGATKTHAPSGASPAIDAGNPTAVGTTPVACAAQDQRGLTRPVDGNADTVAACDIGAVERESGVVTTPTGDDVTVEPLPDVTVTFSNVDAAGATTVQRTTTGTPVPANFNLGNGAEQYFEISTTAVFSGAITVCMQYDPAAFAIEGLIQILHYEDGDWVVAPIVSRDTLDHRVCVEVDSLSPFALAEPLPVAGRGKTETECAAEIAVTNPNNQPLLDKKGFTNFVQTCLDNDPTCDTDGGAAGSCRFVVSVCLNQTDPRFPSCVPTQIGTYTVTKPHPDAIGAAGANGQALADALIGLDGVQGGKHDAVVTFSPALSTAACTSPASITVPLKGKLLTKKGTVDLKIQAADGSGEAQRTDKDQVKLVCLPRP